MKESSRKKISGNQKREIERGVTLIGPHRDDLTIFC